MIDEPRIAYEEFRKQMQRDALESERYPVPEYHPRMRLQGIVSALFCMGCGVLILIVLFSAYSQLVTEGILDARKSVIDLFLAWVKGH
jgi:hypothetical protein